MKISTSISTAAGLWAFWLSQEEIMSFLEPLSHLWAPILYFVLLGALGLISLQIGVDLWREIPETYRQIYGRTKIGQFVALQSDLAVLLPLYPWRSSDRTDTLLLVQFVGNLERLGVPVPDIEYATHLRQYLLTVAKYMAEHDLQGCIQMSHDYEEPELTRAERREEQEEEHWLNY